MINFILTVLYGYIFGGLVFFPVCILSEILFARIRGPEYSAWIMSNINETETETKYTLKGHLKAFAIWPVMFYVWVSALVRDRSMSEHIILIRQEAQERKAKTQEQYDKAWAQLQQKMQEQYDAVAARLRTIDYDFDTRAIWHEVARTDLDLVLHTRAVMFENGILIATHMIMKTPQGWLVFRAMPKPAENVSVAMLQEINAAKHLCNQDLEWIEVCHPSQESARRALWNQMTERLNHCGGPDDETDG